MENHSTKSCRSAISNSEGTGRERYQHILLIPTFLLQIQYWKESFFASGLLSLSNILLNATYVTNNFQQHFYTLTEKFTNILLKSCNDILLEKRNILKCCKNFIIPFSNRKIIL